MVLAPIAEREQYRAIYGAKIQKYFCGFRKTNVKF